MFSHWFYRKWAQTAVTSFSLKAKTSLFFLHTHTLTAVQSSLTMGLLVHFLMDALPIVTQSREDEKSSKFLDKPTEVRLSLRHTSPYWLSSSCCKWQGNTDDCTLTDRNRWIFFYNDIISTMFKSPFHPCVWSAGPFTRQLNILKQILWSDVTVKMSCDNCYFHSSALLERFVSALLCKIAAL